MKGKYKKVKLRRCIHHPLKKKLLLLLVSKQIMNVDLSERIAV